MADQVAHGERAHSLLSASGSSRWMNCTPSARKEEFIPNTENSFALEGTLAHELAETELRKYFKTISNEEYKLKIIAIQENDYYRDDMPEFVDTYVTYCIEQYIYYCSICKTVEVSIEEKIDLTKYIPDGFGSNDFVIIADNHVEVIDLKYGRGYVSAEENPQLKLYGLGTVFKHRLSYNMEDVKLTIVQPRLYSISSFVINVDVLEEWADTEVTTKAKMAYNGEGELKSGEWCKWCRFKPKCRVLYDENIKLMENDFSDPDELSDEEVREIYEKSDQIVSWVNSVNALILSKLMNKGDFTGYKLVKGRTQRKFINDLDVSNALVLGGFTSKDFMSEPKLLGITAIEKLVGKKAFGESYSELVYKTEAKPTVAMESDNRESFFESLEEDFKAEVKVANDFNNALL